MLKKGHKPTAAMKKAGEKNLKKWLDKHPERGAVKHGIWSKHIAKHFSDKRTKKGKQLAAIIEGFTDDLGGNASLNSDQRTLLAFVRFRMIVIFQITDFIDHQQSILNPQGEPLPCLQTFDQYSKSIEKTLDKLFPGKKKPEAQNLDDYLKTTYGKK